MSKTEQNQEIAAAKAGMDAKTARKYLRNGQMPSESRADRSWRTVNNMSEEGEFTVRYEALLRHYRLEGRKIQAGKAGDYGLATAPAKLEVGMVRYSFPVRLFHSLLHAGLSRRTDSPLKHHFPKRNSNELERTRTNSNGSA